MYFLPSKTKEAVALGIMNDMWTSLTYHYTVSITGRSVVQCVVWMQKA